VKSRMIIKISKTIPSKSKKVKIMMTTTKKMKKKKKILIKKMMMMMDLFTIKNNTSCKRKFCWKKSELRVNLKALKNK
jgi:hypothetical protein